jgi:plasmid rolling circle replication initiator protein Rep
MEKLIEWMTTHQGAIKFNDLKDDYDQHMFVLLSSYTYFRKFEYSPLNCYTKAKGVADMHKLRHYRAFEGDIMYVTDPTVL